MSLSLDEFVLDVHQNAAHFRVWWMRKHAENPEHYPLEFPDGDEGAWLEQFMMFEDTE